MKILFLTHRLPFPPNRGGRIRPFHEIKFLSQHHEIDLFCFYQENKERRHLPSLERFCRRVYTEKLLHSSACVRALAAAASGRPFTLAYFYSASFARAIALALQTTSYDVILVHCSSMAQYVEDVTGVRKVLDMADVDSAKWRQISTASRFPLSWLYRQEAKLFGLYEKQVVLKFDTSTICTEAEQRLLKAMAPQASVEVVPFGVDVDFFDPAKVRVPENIRQLQPYIVFTGTMDYLPNIDGAEFFCREIFPRVRRAVPALRAVIVGRNPARRVRQLQREPNVIVTGAVPDIRPYLCGALSAVAPMRMGRGVQNKITEALAMGVPVVATSLPARAVQERVDGAMLVEDDPGAFAERLVALARDDAYRQRLSALASASTRSQCRWEVGLEILERILQGTAIHPAATVEHASSESREGATSI